MRNFLNLKIIISSTKKTKKLVVGILKKTCLKNCSGMLNTLLKHLLHLIFLSFILVTNRLNHEKSLLTRMSTLQSWLASILWDLMDSIFLISSWWFPINFLLNLHLGYFQANQEQVFSSLWTILLKISLCQVEEGHAER